MSVPVLHMPPIPDTKIDILVPKSKVVLFALQKCRYCKHNSLCITNITMITKKEKGQLECLKYVPMNIISLL